MDEALIISLAEQIGRLITIEENILAGGFGAAVAELLSDRGLNHPRLVRLGIPDGFVGFGDRERLCADCGIDAEAVVQAAAILCGEAEIVRAPEHVLPVAGDHT